MGNKNRLTIDTWRGTGITPNGTARRRELLSRGVGDIVTTSFAPVRERVVESNLVSNFMSRGGSRVVGLCGTSRKGRVENNDSAIPVIVLEFVWESRTAEETPANEIYGAHLSGIMGGNPAKGSEC